MSTDRRLQARGLAAKILAFFAANPSEELTIRQVAEKFERNPKTVEGTLRVLRDMGAIENVRIVRLPKRGIAHDSAPMPL